MSNKHVHEIFQPILETTKNIHAVKLGSLGGKARAKKLTPQRRKEISQKANKAKSQSPLNKEIK